MMFIKMLLHQTLFMHVPIIFQLNLLVQNIIPLLDNIFNIAEFNKLAA